MLNAWHLPVAPFVKQNKEQLTITLWLTGENLPQRVTLRAENDNEEIALAMHKLRTQPSPGVTAWRAAIDLRSGQPRRRYSFKLLWLDRQLWFTPQGFSRFPPARLEQFAVDAPDSGPQWVADQVFYQIFPDRFARSASRDAQQDKVYYHHAAGQEIVLRDWDEPLTAQAGGSTFYGGDLDGISEKLPYLKKLGVTALYLNPVFTAPSVHKYDTEDYRHVDPQFGGDQALMRLRQKTQQQGMRLVLDGVFNHVGRGFEPFRDLQEKGEASIYKDWFCNVHFGSSTPLGDAFSYDTWQGNWELVKLNLKNKAVVDHLLSAVKMWVETFDIDGLRLDAADCIDKEFFKQLKVYTQGLKKDFWLMGEIIHGDYKMWANPDMMHSVTNYECWKGIYSSHNDKNYFEIAHSLRRQFAKGGIYENLRLYNFLDNHDVNRIASLLKNPADLENVYTMLFCMPGIPSVYYGSEWGISGVKTSGKEADLPVRPPIEEAEAAKRDTKLEKHIAALSKLRQTTNAPVYGEYADILIRNEQLVFVRQYNKEAVIAAFNIADTAVSLDFEWQGEKYAVELAPHDSRVIVKE